ncbi:membrane protein [Arthrobacter phage Uzumaki]|nr:membrane protein [Arthrobacter phage Uzumaki]
MKKLLALLGIAALLALGGTALSATPAAPVTHKAQAASYTSCYWAMNGGYYCYRYGCTYFEKVALGCFNGYVRMNTRVYV